MDNQFKPIPKEPKKQVPPQQSGATKRQGEQIQPGPANPGSVRPPIQQSAGTPYSPTQQPYLQPPPGLPGIPILPGTQKNVQPTHPPIPPGNPKQSAPKPIPPSPLPNGPQPFGNLVPPNTPSSTNRAGKNRSIVPPSTYPNNPPVNVPINSYSGNSNQNAGQSLNNMGNPIFPGGPPTAYAGNSFAGMQGNPNQQRGSAFERTPALGPSELKPPKKKRKKRLPLIARIAIGFLVFLLIVAGGIFAYYEIALAPYINNITGKQATHQTITNNNNAGTVSTGRTNILLLGSDTDGKGNDPTNGMPLAQTVMIITVDTQNNYVGMLSIPRDMQVTDPYNNSVTSKLDEVFEHYYTGNNLTDKVAAGAGAMEDAIQANYGVHIDHYAWVGLGGFVKVIDTAGGVDVDTIHPMVDDTYPNDVNNPNGSIYDYERLYIPPGPQHLDGTHALDYVRTRHSDLVGDFGRTIRQQQIISELKTKLATPDTIGKASELLQDLNGSLQTDMSLSDIIGLANFARNIDNNSVDRVTLGPPDYATQSTDGSSNYWPICDSIIQKIQKMFNTSAATCIPQADSSNGSLAHSTQSTTTSTTTALNAASELNQDTNTASTDTTTNTTGAPMDAGVHSLLDLLFTTTFESFDAIQI